jgi:predicted RNA-binding protein
LKPLTQNQEYEMTLEVHSSSFPSAVYLDHPVVGMTSPEFQEFAKAVIKAIARRTKKMFRAVAGGIVRIWRYIDKKVQEGAEIHNRQTQMLDERYARNFYHLRSYL